MIKKLDVKARLLSSTAVVPAAPAALALETSCASAQQTGGPCLASHVAHTTPSLQDAHKLSSTLALRPCLHAPLLEMLNETRFGASATVCADPCAFGP
jgi:hypothetical protein